MPIISFNGALRGINHRLLLFKSVSNVFTRLILAAAIDKFRVQMEEHLIAASDTCEDLPTVVF